MSRYEIGVTALQRSLQIYDSAMGESLADKTRYSTSMLLTDLGCNECRLHLVSGVLNDEINGLVMELVRSLGFERIQFEVPEGSNASRHAMYDKTVDGLDRYVVELN